MPAAAMSLHDDSPGLDESAVASETALDSSANPRKRKKSSRACDYCHVNHQPCDNAKPRCGYCERHGKTCLYLRPQKKRGPAQGYRSALYSMRESAAAWGAVLHLVPTLAPVIEGYFKKEEGRRLIRAIRDPQQQDFYIQTWQQSSVFKAFFGDDTPPCGDETVADGASQSCSDAPTRAPQTQAQPAQQTQPLQPTQPTQPIQPIQPQPTLTQTQTHQPPSHQHPPHQPPHQSSHSISPVPPSSARPLPATSTAAGALATQRTDLGLHPLQMAFGMPPGTSQPPPSQPPPSQSPAHPSHTPHTAPYLFPPLPQAPLSSLPYDPKVESLMHAPSQGGSSMQTLGGSSSSSSLAGLGVSNVSLSDILARAAAQPSNNFSQALGSLGFAPEETLSDFVAMSYNPDILDGSVDADPLLGSDLDQKAYYELLMGRRFS